LSLFLHRSMAMKKPIRSLASAFVTLVVVAFSLSAALAMVACSGGDDPVAVTGVTVTPATLTVTAGKTATTQLAAIVVPANAANKDVTWESSAPGTATVAGSGLSATVTGVALGTATITATLAGDATKKATCTVKVTLPVEGVSVLPATLSIAVGAQGILEAAVAPAGANKTVEWSSSDTTKATVAGDGLGATVTAVAPGPVTITAASTDDATKKGVCAVTVVPAAPDPDGVTVAPMDLSLKPNATGTLTATVSPAGAGQAVTWTSDDETVATVIGSGNGQTATVTAVAEGTARITATAVGFPGIFGACDVTVKALAFADMTISASWAHSLGIKADGSLWAWGAGSFGKLGLGDSAGRNVPTRVGTDDDWTAVATGTESSLALKADGSLWAWGFNGEGQLGLGDTTNRDTPQRVGNAADWAAVATHSHHAAALKVDGSLWAWGANYYGELGLGDTRDRNVPTMVGADSEWAAVEAGQDHTVAIKQDGSLWAWGSNATGQLGIGAPEGDTQKDTPQRVGMGSDWAFVACGYLHTLAIKEDGSLWAWGFNGLGQLGDGTYTGHNAPVPTSGSASWAAVATGLFHTLGVTEGGSILACGGNGYGQVGDGTWETRSVLVPVGAESDWAAVSAGGYHSLAVKVDGSLWAWGDNYNGQLGLGDNGDTTHRNAPALVGDGWRVPVR
jgi:alpha-tubulin suppressor-like RCC1 family protein/uncharacterized protein YjdB